MQKVAILTGSSGNLGPVWLETLKEMDYQVFEIDLPLYDITNIGLVKNAIDKCLRDYGKPSVIVCNAAIDNPPAEKSGFWDNYEKIIGVNLVGHLHLLSNLLPGNVAENAVVINIGSIMGHSGADWRRYKDIGLDDFTKPVAYNLSKRALIQLSQSITTEFGRFGIRSVTLSFGPVNTDKMNIKFKTRIAKDIPLGHLVSTDDLKRTLRWAIRTKSLAGSQDVLIDGGLLAW